MLTTKTHYEQIPLAVVMKIVKAETRRLHAEELARGNREEKLDEDCLNANTFDARGTRS